MGVEKIWFGGSQKERVVYNALCNVLMIERGKILI